MNKFTKRLALLGGLLACSQVQATNWLMLQGTEPAGAAARAKVWGFIQPEYQATEGGKLPVGPGAGQVPIFNRIGPDLDSDSTFQIRRARIGVRGTGFPLDSKVNYFILTEFGNNAITNWGSDGPQVSDASITLNHFKGARIRIGLFKTPGGEEMIEGIPVINYINFTNFANQQLLERIVNEDGSRPSADPKFDGNMFEGAGAFRDVGIQIFDAFRQGDWEHSYAVMIGNGNGIELSDRDNDKDLYLKWSSELIFNNSKGPRREGLKLFAWYQDGERTLDYVDGVAGKQTFDRTRWGLGTTYNKDKWRARAEYYKAEGMIFCCTTGGQAPGKDGNTASYTIEENEEADGWYVDVGYKIMPNLELDLRYDTLNRATNNTNNAERELSTTTLGLQYFFNKKTRLTFNYEFRSFEAPNFPDSAPPNLIADSIDDRWGLQLTAIF